MKKIFFLMIITQLLSCAKDGQEYVILNGKYLKGVNFFYYIDPNSPTIQLSWDYPVKPGTENWKKFQSHKEMTDACQIPENILSSLSTKELTIICLQYPLLTDIFAFNIPDDGIDALFNNFNGIRELFNRKEGTKELLSWYNCQIRNCSLLVGNENISEEDTEKFLISISVLEYLLSRAKDNYMDVLKNLVLGYETKLQYPDYISSGLSHNLFSRAHIIDKMCTQCFDDIPNKGSLFVTWYFKEYIDIINKLSYMLIK